MELKFVLDSKLKNVLNELKRRELFFHRPQIGTSRADFERMIEPTFREVGASGRQYSREHALDLLERRCADPAKDNGRTRDFHCIKIAADNFLLTYTLTQGVRITRRATIWRQTAEGWKIVFHQGTIVQDR